MSSPQELLLPLFIASVIILIYLELVNVLVLRKVYGKALSDEEISDIMDGWLKASKSDWGQVKVVDGVVYYVGLGGGWFVSKPGATTPISERVCGRYYLWSDGRRSGRIPLNSRYTAVIDDLLNHKQ